MLNESEVIERDLGEQPLTAILSAEGISHHQLVAGSPEPITHKMVTRACKGRRLTGHSQRKIQAAVNKVTKKTFRVSDLFNYR